MIVNDQNKRQRRTLGLALLCALLQLALAPSLVIGAGHPNFCLIFAIITALTGGGVYSYVAAFFAGLFFDFTATTPVGLMTFELTLCAFALGYEDRDRIVEEPKVAYRVGVFAILVVELAYQLVLCLMGQGGSFIDVVFLRWLPASLWDCLALLPFVLVYSKSQPSGLTLGGKTPKNLNGHRYKL